MGSCEDTDDEPDVLAECVYDEDAVANGTMYTLTVVVCVSVERYVVPSRGRQCTASRGSNSEIDVELDGLRVSLRVSCGVTAMFAYAVAFGTQFLFVFVLGGSTNAGVLGADSAGVNNGNHGDTLLLLQDVMSCTEALRVSAECIVLPTRSTFAKKACVRSINTRVTYTRVFDEQSLAASRTYSPWSATKCPLSSKLTACG